MICRCTGFAPIFILAFAFGCSSSDASSGGDAGQTGGDAAPTDAGTGASQDGAVAASDAGIDAPSDASSDAPIDGATDSGDGGSLLPAYVYILTDPNSASFSNATIVEAAFLHAPEAGCTESTNGPCTTTSCIGAPPTPYDSAGTVTITTKAGSPIATMTYPGSSDTYHASVPSIHAGDVFVITASGATVPAFTLTTEATPPRVTLTAPAAGDGGKLAIDATKDVAFAWSGGVAGNVVRVQLDAYLANGSISARCDFDAASGSGVVPSAALAGFSGQEGTVEIGQEKPTSVVAGRWRVDVRSAVWPFVGATF